MKAVLIILMTVVMTGCSTFNSVFPDRSREYERAQTLPNLEIPPDLVAGGINDSMAIPGETRRVVTAPGQQTGTALPAGQAIIERINNNKPLLSIPEEFTSAWVEVDRILVDAGITINNSDRSNGIFNVTFTPDAPSSGGGFISRMFGRGGIEEQYQVSLTGVGNKTELVILDLGGEWVSSETSDNLLTTIRDHYNLARSQ